MINRILAVGLTAFVFSPFLSLAQAPAAVTGQCNDGTYTTAPSKSGACSGHKGVKMWNGKPTAATKTKSAAMKTEDATKTAAMKTGDATKTAAVKTGDATKTAATKTGDATMNAADKTGDATKSAGMKTKNRAGAAMTTEAPGGGPGMVWVNTSSKVYHCSGSTYYGKTKEGKYMTESDAMKMGAKADRGKPCMK